MSCFHCIWHHEWQIHCAHAATYTHCELYLDFLMHSGLSGLCCTLQISSAHTHTPSRLNCNCSYLQKESINKPQSSASASPPSPHLSGWHTSVSLVVYHDTPVPANILEVKFGTELWFAKLLSYPHTNLWQICKQLVRSTGRRLPQTNFCYWVKLSKRWF